MRYMPRQGQFALLPDSPTPWIHFVLSMGGQSLAVVVLAWLAILHPAVLSSSAHPYSFVPLVSTPTVINNVPAPERVFQKPLVVARLAAPENLKPMPEPPEPKLDIDPPSLPTARQPAVPLAAPVVPATLVKTNVFSTGSSLTPTIARPPQQVQTGGFGDPNAVPAQPNNVRQTTIAKLGSFGLPSGPGSGDGTHGARGVTGVVASAGFGSETATGSAATLRRATVQQGGFEDANAPVAAPVQSKAAQNTANTLPAEILSKPTPTYTEEARKLRLEGEVLLEVVLGASGQLRVVRVVRGLGHGLDENAIRAAEQIRFRPALQNGQPTDSTALLRIIFQLA
jgi:TonB family protein